MAQSRRSAATWRERMRKTDNTTTTHSCVCAHRVAGNSWGSRPHTLATSRSVSAPTCHHSTCILTGALTHAQTHPPHSHIPIHPHTGGERGVTPGLHQLTERKVIAQDTWSQEVTPRAARVLPPASQFAQTPGHRGSGDQEHGPVWVREALWMGRVGVRWEERGGRWWWQLEGKTEGSGWLPGSAQG